MPIRLFLIAALSLCPFLLRSQIQFQYFKVSSSSDEPITSAVLNAGTSNISYFSSEAGIISIPKDSLMELRNIVVGAARHNPKKLERKLKNLDTILVELDVYRSVAYNETNRLRGFELMKPIFLQSYMEEDKIENEILQKRILYLNEIPIDIKGVSGRIIPGENDKGKVLGALRWSDVDYKSKNNFQEEVLARIDSGLFRDLGAFSSLDLVWNIENENFSMNPFSNLEYPSPIKQVNSLKYQYYLVDSIQHDDETIYRIDIKPAKPHSPLFNGSVWREKQSGKLLEVHLNLYKENHVNYVDSIHIHFYNPRFIGLRKGASQHAEIWVNILNYKMKFDANTILLGDSLFRDTTSYPDKFRVIEPRRTTTSDSLQYFNSIINGNTSVLDGLENTSSITSKNYKVNSILNNKVDFARAFFLTGGNYHAAKGFIEVVPLALSMGFNTVEGWYVNYRAHYHFEKKESQIRFSPYLRYGLASKRWLPRAEFYYQFNPKDPVKVVIEGGAKYQQFNELEPIIPIINTAYSLILSNNYLKLYQKEYIKFKFDKEIFRGLEAVFSFEAGRRTALFNNTDFTIFSDGKDYTPNNPERTLVISSKDGFRSHNMNIINLQLYYQFGRRYDFVDNELRKLESPLPRLSFLYRKGFGYNEGMPNYSFIRFSAGNKTRLKDIGLFEFDLVFGGFYNVEHIEFVDFQHFNGVQTSFINNSYDGWTDVRQFSTLPYYDYSTSKSYVEVHLKHRFLGWLLSKPALTREFNLQSYVGTNYLYTGDVGHYSEVYFGVENIFKVINLQTALGVDQDEKVRFSVLVGINFDLTFYLNARER